MVIILSSPAQSPLTWQSQCVATILTVDMDTVAKTGKVVIVIFVDTRLRAPA